MFKRILKAVFTLAIIAAVAAAIFYWRPEFSSVSEQAVKQAQNLFTETENFFSPPCVEPLYYSIGEVDERFGLTDEVLKKTLAEAIGVWNKPTGQELFAYKEDGAIKINLVYDYRQAATDKLKKLGIVVENNQKSYDDLKARYDELNRQYKIQQASLAAATSSYAVRLAEYETEVDKWNALGGAPKNVYERLTSQKAALDTEVARINSLTNQLNQLADAVNAEAVALNQLVEALNLTVEKYNSIGQSTGEEFREGEYVRDAGGQRINIFQFNNHNQLVRLLAHEFGHALGLEHTSSSADIMYYLNDSDGLSLSANDLSSVKAFCHLTQ